MHRYFDAPLLAFATPVLPAEFAPLRFSSSYSYGSALPVGIYAMLRYDTSTETVTQGAKTVDLAGQILTTVTGPFDLD